MCITCMRQADPQTNFDDGAYGQGAILVTKVKSALP